MTAFKTLLALGLVASLAFWTPACGPESEPSVDAAGSSGSNGDDTDEGAGKPAQAQPALGDDPAMKTIRDFISEQQIDKTQANWKTKLPKPPKAEFDPDRNYYWNLKTNKGDIKIRLMTDVAPMHVSSTIYLTELGFYDGLTFHRVIPQFMAQGGDPLGNGRGGPGYKYAGEFDPTVRHDRPGLLSMANAGPRTDGSQFFLTFVPYPSLDDKHTIFGEVVAGMDTMKKLEAEGSRTGATRTRLEMTKASISIE